MININIISIIFAIIAAYLIGSFSMSYIISKKVGINLKEKGSKNYGASNTLALIGKRAGLMALVSDILKAPIAIFIGKTIYEFLTKTDINSEMEMMFFVILAVSAIMGHIFPIHLKFKGGKGFATYIGTLITLSFFNIKILLIPLLGIILALVSNYIVAATFTVILMTPLFLLLIEKEVLSAFVLFFASGVIFIKHIENIKHIKDGTEMKIREAFKKKYKEK